MKPIHKVSSDVIPEKGNIIIHDYYSMTKNDDNSLFNYNNESSDTGAGILEDVKSKDLLWMHYTQTRPVQKQNKTDAVIKKESNEAPRIGADPVININPPKKPEIIQEENIPAKNPESNPYRIKMLGVPVRIVRQSDSR